MRFEELAGKVAVVTGAGSGLGRATAEAFAREGAAVVLGDLDAAAAEAAAEAIRTAGGRACAVEVDVGRSDDVARLVGTAQARFGRIDVLVNNAGISGHQGRPLADVDEAVFDRVIEVNLKGVWLGMKHAIPPMIAQGGGCIVNMSSTLGWVGQSFSAAYAASKHGVVGLTKTGALEYGMQGVRINAVCPGGIETALTDRFRASMSATAWDARNRAVFPATGRYGRPEEVAAVVLFLCSDGASNIHGVALPADGGYVAQ